MPFRCATGPPSRVATPQRLAASRCRAGCARADRLARASRASSSNASAGSGSSEHFGELFKRRPRHMSRPTRARAGITDLLRAVDMSFAPLANVCPTPRREKLRSWCVPARRALLRAGHADLRKRVPGCALTKVRFFRDADGATPYRLNAELRRSPDGRNSRAAREPRIDAARALAPRAPTRREAERWGKLVRRSA